MRRSACAATLGILAFLTQTGCRSGGLPLINLLGIDRPLVVALVAEKRPAESPLDLLNPFAPHERLRDALGADLHRSVALDLALPLQVEPNLNLGFYHVAVLPMALYCRLSDPTKFRAVAIPLDEQGQATRPGLLVVPAKSNIQAVADLKGKSVAFGPRRELRTFYAGLELLKQNGVQKSDLSLEVLPVPGSFKRMLDSRSVAQSVVNGSSAAGFVDEEYFESLPESSTKADEPARDQLRVIAKTALVPDRIVILSPTLDEATAQKLTDFLLSAGEKHPDALRPLNYTGYAAPPADLLELCRQIVKLDDAPLVELD